MTDHQADRLLTAARGGCVRSRQRLLCWMYGEAQAYFRSKVISERLLSPQDASDLAAESVIEFERVMFRVRRVHRYVRRMFRNNLLRFLTRKRIRENRETHRPDLEAIEMTQDPVVMDLDSVFGGLTDRQRRHVHVALARMECADPSTRDVMTYRLAVEPLSYREIGALLNTSETALRMRVARFCRSVREECARVEQRRKWRYPAVQPMSRRVNQ